MSTVTKRTSGVPFNRGTPSDQQQVGKPCHEQVENGKQCGPASYLAGKDWIIQRQRYRGLRPGRRPHLCHHEAGHCVALWHFGYTFRRVSVLTVAEVRQGVQLMNEYDEALAGTEGCVVGHDLGFSLASGCDPEVLEALGMPPETVAEARRALQAAVEMNSVCIYAGMVAEARYRKCSRDWVLITSGAADRARAKDLRETWMAF
jgi:hypothetical protein